MRVQEMFAFFSSAVKFTSNEVHVPEAFESRYLCRATPYQNTEDQHHPRKFPPAPSRLRPTPTTSQRQLLFPVWVFFQAPEVCGRGSELRAEGRGGEGTDAPGEAEGGP